MAIRRARVTPLFFILSRQIVERVDRALDRRLAEAAGGGNALAEPDDAGKRVDHAEAVAGRTRDQQAAIIGAEIERGIGRAAAIARRMLAVDAVQATADPTGTAAAAPDRQRGRGRGLSPASPLIMSKPSCRAGRLSRLCRLRQCSLDREKCNSARASTQPSPRPKPFLWNRAVLLYLEQIPHLTAE